MFKQFYLQLIVDTNNCYCCFVEVVIVGHVVVLMLTETAANILKLCINKSTHLELHITQRSSNIKDFLVSGFPSTNCYRLQVVHFYDNSPSCIEPQTKFPNDTLCRAASLKGQGIPSGTRCTWCVTIWNLITPLLEEGNVL